MAGISRPRPSAEWVTRVLLAPTRLATWDRLPTWVGAFSLIGMRQVLRRKNLYDTSAVDLDAAPTTPDAPTNYRTARTINGTYNDLDFPLMGAAGTRFGRNVPLENTVPETGAGLLHPNPRQISLQLMTRTTFMPATTLNVLAAAWIQFNVHDWMTHGEADPEKPWELDLEDGDSWAEERMRIQRTRADEKHGKGDGAPTYTNQITHWWDASQVYGGTPERLAMLRTGQGGKLRVQDDGLLPVNPDNGFDMTGFDDNYWVGLSALHTLFTREHNAICDMLAQRHPGWSDDEFFDHARLITSALIAKIHTVEWTPGILSHPAVVLGMNANWWGLQGQWLHRKFGRFAESEVVSGIPGSDTNHHGAPYAITQEFVSVYRLHPLLPEDFIFRSARNDMPRAQVKLMDVQGKATRPLVEQLGLEDILYSLGTSHPGQIRLHNYPRAFQALEKRDGTVIDLAATEIVRDRERGVPRYNEFRKFLGKPPVTRFEDLTDNPAWVQQLKRVYENDINRVDLLVGLLSEPLPAGFGFSETAFRIFVLMASRRLKSDRFFTAAYRPENYTQEGLDWIDRNTMTTVLLRHFPGLSASLKGVPNAFGPWARA